ncbi:MAG: discoidin domain-containing protein [Spirochaetota bacterium]
MKHERMLCIPMLSAMFAASVMAYGEAALSARYIRVEQANGVLALAEVEVFSGTANIAHKGTPSQSSTAYGGEAARAVDGNTAGSWAGNSITHTSDATNAVSAWWEVDLGKDTVIDCIRVWNRTDPCCSGRLKGASVIVLSSARAVLAKAIINDTDDTPFIKSFSALGASNALRGVVDEYPSVTLTNGSVELIVYLPDAEKGFGRGPRFDRSAMVGRAGYRGHTWFGQWLPGKHDPVDANASIGMGGDFGTGQAGAYGALGYDEAKPGETFVRIGVGELRKPMKPEYIEYNSNAVFGYRISFRYTIVRVFPWEIQLAGRFIEFRQDVRDVCGYSFRYTRRIELTPDAPGFVSKCMLENTGGKRIIQSYYNHNFIMIDGKPIGPDYRLTFGFTPQLKDVKKDAAALFSGRTLSFSRLLQANESAGYLLTGSDASAAHSAADIYNSRTKAGLRMTMDAPPVIYNLYITPKVICPEPIITIDVPPGGKKEWQTRYEFRADSPLGK